MGRKSIELRVVGKIPGSGVNMFTPLFVL